jgi:hypothetical protein
MADLLSLYVDLQVIDVAVAGLLELVSCAFSACGAAASRPPQSAAQLRAGAPIYGALPVTTTTVYSSSDAGRSGSSELQHAMRAFRTGNVSAASLRKWEAFIHDGREIAAAAQLLECASGFCVDAVDYVEHMTVRGLGGPFYAEWAASGARDVYMPRFLTALFEAHARKHAIRVSDAMALWLPKFEEALGAPNTAPLRDLHDRMEWEWDDDTA